MLKLPGFVVGTTVLIYVGINVTSFASLAAQQTLLTLDLF